MQKDKNEEKRNELTRAILELEYQEEDFFDLKNRFEASLEEFYAHFSHLLHQEEECLYRSSDGDSSVLARDAEYHETVFLRMRQYVDESIEQLSEAQRQVRHRTDEERERLIKERNALPWD